MFYIRNCCLVLRKTCKLLIVNKILRGVFLEIILSNYLANSWLPNKFPTYYALFFSTKKKACQEKTYRTEVVFEDKNFQFLSKKTTSLRRSSSCTPFERSEKQCVVSSTILVTAVSNVEDLRS